MNRWLKTGAILLMLLVAVYLVPNHSVDSWKIFNPQKILKMILALASVQTLGLLACQFWGARAGAIFSGFLGGLISSTATTASVARTSKTAAGPNADQATLTLLSATLAMLGEALVIAFFGTNDVHVSLSLIFLGPLIMTLVLMRRHSHEIKSHAPEAGRAQLAVASLLKLSAFVLAILALSKFLQTWLGVRGLAALTFLVSLFEIHGSIMANVQLHDADVISVQFLGLLLSLSVAASYLSKGFLVLTLGDKNLKISTFKSIAWLLASLAASWFVFRAIV